MALKILPKRSYARSDSSDSSPELEEKKTKWTLFRRPLKFNQQNPMKTATTATQKQPNIPLTSTPCLKSAPSFQLTQILLSPVEKLTDTSIKVPKPGKKSAAKDNTFDNLLASQFVTDTSSNLVVKRREKPLQRRNNEADLERTRQYAGRGIRPKNLVTDDFEESKLTAVSPVKEFQEKTQGRRGREATSKPKRDFVTGKVIADEAGDPKRPTKKVGVQGRDERNLVPFKTAEIAQQQILLSAPSESSDRRLSLRSSAGTGVLQPVGNIEEECNCSDTSSFGSPQNEGGDDKTGEGQCNGSNVSLRQVHRSSPRRIEVEKESSNVVSRQVLRSSPRLSEIQNKSSSVSLLSVQQISRQRKSSPLPKSSMNEGKENLGSENNCNVAAADAHSSKNGDMSQQNLNLNNKQTAKEDHKTEQQKGAEINSSVLSKTSKPEKVKVQIVSGKGDVSSLTEKRAGVGTPVHLNRSKRKTLNDIVEVLQKQRSFENKDVKECARSLEVFGLKPDSHSSRNDIPEIKRFEENGSIKNSEEHRPKDSLRDVTGRDGETDDPVHKETGKAELTAGRSRKENESVVVDTKLEEDGNAGTRQSIKENVSFSSSAQKEDGKAESTAGRSRKKNESVVGDTKHAEDGNAGRTSRRSKQGSETANSPVHTENEKSESAASRNRKESENIVVDTKHMEDNASWTTSTRQSKKSLSASRPAHKENEKSESTAGRSRKGIERVVVDEKRKDDGNASLTLGQSKKKTLNASGPVHKESEKGEFIAGRSKKESESVVGDTKRENDDNARPTTRQSKQKGVSASGPIHKQDGKAESTAGRSRKESESVVGDTKREEDGNASLTLGQGKKKTLNASGPVRKESEKAESTAGRSRKESESVIGDTKRENDDNARPTTRQSKQEGVSASGLVHKQDGKAESAAGRSRKESESIVVDTKHVEDNNAGRTISTRQSKRESLSASRPAHKENEKSESTAGRSRKESERVVVDANGNASLTLGPSKKKTLNPGGPVDKENGEGEFTEGRSRKKSESAGNTKYSGTSTAASPAGGSRKGNENTGSLEYKKNGKGESAANLERNECGRDHQSADLKTRRGRKERGGANNLEHEENGKADPTEKHYDKEQERSDGSDKNKPPHSTGVAKTRKVPMHKRCFVDLGQDLFSEKRLKSNRSREESRSMGNLLNKKSVQSEESEEVSSEKKTDGKSLKRKTENNLTPQKDSSGSPHGFERRSKRERRRPGHYWVAAPTPPPKKARSEICREAVKRRTVDYSSGCESDTSSGNKSHGKRCESRKLKKDSADEEKEETDTILNQYKKRRLLPKKEFRRNMYSMPIYSHSDSEGVSQGLENADFYASGGSTAGMFSHAANVKFINKNSGLPSENPKVRIGSTIAWKSISGSIVELEPGAACGPQVDVQNNQVFVVLEGTIAIQRLVERTRKTLKSGDSAILPTGHKYTILNNDSRTAKFYVVKVTDIV